ncbi:MAG: hypothetical protein N4A35_03310 [Flavobacteriales bacterium]|jgi:hypothetical protein|nr:hypothetical protein [Flavobacteriales bacterium]
MKFKTLTFFILTFLVGPVVYGQYTSGSKKKKKTHGGKSAHHSVIKADFKLPTPTGDKMFRGILDGMIDLDFSYNYRLLNDFAFGAGMKYGFWDIDVNSFPSDKVNGSHKIINPFVSVSRVFQQNRQLFIEAEVKVGYNNFNTTSEYNGVGYTYKTTGVNFEPKVGVYLQTQSDLLSIGLTVNYNYMTAGFSEKNLGVAKLPGFAAGTGGDTSQYFSIGFGFYTFLPNKDDIAASKEH